MSRNKYSYDEIRSRLGGKFRKLFGPLDVLHLVEGFSGLLELLVHGEELPHSGVHAGVLPHQEDDVLHL
jgi:hypothetical protein